MHTLRALPRGPGNLQLTLLDLGVFSVDKNGCPGMTLIDLADGETANEIKVAADAEAALDGSQPDAV